MVIYLETRKRGGDKQMYMTLIKCSFKQQIQYKWDLLFHIIGDWLRIYIKICIWNALLKAGTGDGADFKSLAAYTIVASMVMLLTKSHVAEDLSDRVRSGMIAVDLIRPISLKWYCFFNQIGENLFSLLFEGILIAVISWKVWSLPLPEINIIIPFVLCLTMGIIIMFYIQYIIGLLVFWMKDGTYTNMITYALFVMFSGIEIPLWFYPDWLRGIGQVLPFRFIVHEPIVIWLGQMGVREIAFTLMMQMFWLMTLFLTERKLWNFIKKNIEIQGG
jgi:ABC-2 type transport system permease protein